MKKERAKKRLLYRILFVLFIFSIYIGLYDWTKSKKNDCYFGPIKQQQNMDLVLKKDQWSEEDYRFLFYQTGLGRRAIEILNVSSRNSQLKEMQRTFYLTPKIHCYKSSIFTWEERNCSEKLPAMVGVQNGDILITFSSRVFGWRNGHVGMVVDEKKGETLESVFIGESSCIQSTKKWCSYPAFIVLRLKSATKEERDKISEYAKLEMQEIPYGFVSDFIEHLGFEGEMKDADCSYLIWSIYKKFGYDLDSDGGFFVTPKDISESPFLEVVQIYGVDMKKVKEK